MSYKIDTIFADKWHFPSWHMFNEQSLTKKRTEEQVWIVQSQGGAECGDDILGYMMFDCGEIADDPFHLSKTGEIYFLQTNPAYLRRGVAAYLLEALFRIYAKTLWYLDCSINDDIYIARLNLYARHGFVWAGTGNGHVRLARSSDRNLLASRYFRHNTKEFLCPELRKWYQRGYSSIIAGLRWDPEQEMWTDNPSYTG